VKVSLGPKTIVHPHPVFLVGTYDSEDKPNLATVSWGGICCSEPPCVAVSLREATLTFHNIKKNKAFTVGIPSASQSKIADFAGVVSGRDTNKFRQAGLTALKSEKVHAPYAEEFPYSLECRLLHVLKIGLHTLFVGEIVNVLSDKEVLNAKGWPDIRKVNPILYGSRGNPSYFGMGEELGKAFHIGHELKK